MEDWGTVPQNLRWGTAHASVPPIFGEVVLLEACENTNREKAKIFLCEIEGSTTQKSHHKFSAVK